MFAFYDCNSCFRCDVFLFGSHHVVVRALISIAILIIVFVFIFHSSPISDRMVTDPERKAALFAEYHASLSSIPCRHFNFGKGSCPFGSSCFYMHCLPVRPRHHFTISQSFEFWHGIISLAFFLVFYDHQDGSLAAPAPIRFMANDEGQFSSVRKVTLSDFLADL